MESYTDYQDRVKTEQADLSKDEIMDNLEAEYKLDLESLPKLQHNWVKRGIKVSCEGAGHPHHSHFLRNQ
jgi:hypothetical protein